MACMQTMQLHDYQLRAVSLDDGHVPAACHWKQQFLCCLSVIIIIR